MAGTYRSKIADPMYGRVNSFLNSLLAPQGIQYYEVRAEREGVDPPIFSLEKIRDIWIETYGTGFLWKLRFWIWMIFPHDYQEVERDWSGYSTLAFRFKRTKEGNSYKMLFGYWNHPTQSR